jgi:hypothetical protein
MAAATFSENTYTYIKSYKVTDFPTLCMNITVFEM